MKAAGQPLLTVQGLTKHFPLTAGLFGRSAGSVRAVDDVSFVVRQGETLGIVGESGCGKSTTSRLIMQLMRPTAGEVIFDGLPVGPGAESVGGISTKEYRRQVQMVFQDSYSSLNPRLTIGDSIAFAPAGPWHAAPHCGRSRIRPAAPQSGWTRRNSPADSRTSCLAASASG